MKRFIKILIVGLLGITLFIFTACERAETNPAFESGEEVYAFSILSATSLLHGEANVGGYDLSNKNNSIKYTTLAEEDDLAVVEELDEINKYLNIMEKFLGDNPLEVNLEDSELIEYTKKLVITVSNLLGEETTYEVYYNERAIIDDEDDDDDEDDGDETETETELDGMMIVEDVQYTLVGTREYEDGEEEISLRAFIDESNYVDVKYEYEEGEREFKFETVVDNELISRTKIEVEIEDNETEVELEFVYGVAVGKYEFKEDTEDGNRRIKIEYEVTDELGNAEEGEIKVYVLVDDTTGETTYEYQIENENGVRKYNKDRKEDRHDEDDDEEDDD